MQTILLPYQRTPLHLPRRDLVLASADSLSLRFTIIESDDPSAQALYLSGGMGGPELQFSVWRSRPDWLWDYGLPPFAWQPEVLWTGAGTISDAVGSFDLLIPAGTMACWPRRCGWSVQLGWGGGLIETLAGGMLHVQRVWGPSPPVVEAPITTDSLVPITTD